ncbi:hypothetical protein [Streptomyces sp. NPDC050738]|uniref:hypothetical protein n=1 Tax=Streptomyces sp. NPDC050738 TaxID=3154744 RepID=UPI00341A2295
MSSVVGALLWAGVPAVPGGWLDLAPEAEAAELSEGQQALAEAADSGERVEVTGERTEFTTTYANPDGFTFHLEQSVTPVRVKQAGGA